MRRAKLAVFRATSSQGAVVCCEAHLELEVLNNMRLESALRDAIRACPNVCV
jgi:hypothetical protein